ncbi:MAG: class I SAM-dependent methyltransferase, partial [Patescibacteria group bacterium]
KYLFIHAHYEATDFIDPHGLLNFTCSLDKIPRKAGTYDVVLLTEVLEHVEYPQKVINEINRILKKGGKLFLTTPQQYMLHQKPYNFYYFTRYGLESLLKNAGFKSYSIRSMGGYFWTLGDLIKFNSVLTQYKRWFFIYYPLKLVEWPLTQLIIPFILFHLDWLDKQRDWTMGYTVEAIK